MTAMTEPVLAADFDAAMMEDVERGGLWIRVACFDNGGETADRYTVLVEADPPWGQDDRDGPSLFTYTASPDPFYPQGVGLTDDGWLVADTDTLIGWSDLPPRVQQAVWSAAGSHWMLGTPTGYVEFTYSFEAGGWVARFVEREGDR